MASSARYLDTHTMKVNTHNLAQQGLWGSGLTPRVNQRRPLRRGACARAERETGVDVHGLVGKVSEDNTRVRVRVNPNP